MKLKRYLYKKVESTNNVAIRLIKKGNQSGIILTDQQTKGKGKGKNRWISLKGNLFISIFFEIEKKGINFKQYAILNAYLLKKILSKFSLKKIDIKWPNDLLFKGKKIAGILCEYHSRKNPAVIIGIGINVNQIKFPAGLKDIATSLKLEFGKDINRTALIKSLITQLDLQYNKFQNNKVQAILNNLTRNTDLFGKTISLNKGNQFINGKAIRLDNHGRLVILNDSGKEVAFDSGEVGIE